MTSEVTLLLPVGRIVGGHPMKTNPRTDNQGNPKIGRDGQPSVEMWVGVAIPKGGEAHWNQTSWGQQIHAAAVAGWPRGEYGAPTFAWKITDGDSQIPNKRGTKPCEREGYPGHWVVGASSGYPIPCYHVGHYQAHEVIKQEGEIKAGDYVRLQISVKPNGSIESPGMYINPLQLELSRAGQEIVLSSVPNAAEAFGGSAPAIPPGAAVDTAVQAPPAAPAAPAAPVTPQAPAAPASDIMTPPAPAAPAAPPAPAAPATYTINGRQYTADQLIASGWTQAQIDAL